MTLSPGGTDAGRRLIPYYQVAERAFPILPDDVEIHDDTPAGSFGLAWYNGLSPVTGKPMFRVRDDVNVVQVPYVGFHEAGHAFQTVVARAVARITGVAASDVVNAHRNRYWVLRGFPGSWWDAQQHAISAGGWSFFPDESFADAFAHAVFGYSAGEWTWNYGRPIDVALTRAFLKQLEREALGGDDLDEQTTRRIAEQVADERLARFALLQRETGHDPIRDAFNDHEHRVRLEDGTPLEMLTGGPLVKLGNQ
jgi:hypothetical protein